MKKTSIILFACLLLFYADINSQIKFDEKWITYFEKTDFKGSPDYYNSIKYFRQFADDFESVEMKTFGISPQGRELKYLVVSKDKAFTPELAKKVGKPVIFLQNGIHAGEIEGKEAVMLLLREMLVTKEKEHLLDNVIFIIVPVFNVDGHERRSPYGRINQNGPEIMGWRTTSQNLNLNRDYLKADAPEMRAMLKLYNEWIPDIYIDTHTTNGADYQYTVTYIVDRNQNLPSVTRNWVRNKFIPAIINGAESKGFLICPYVAFDDNLESGIYDFVSSPKLSTGFASAHNRPEVTIETHMLKPYKERVYSTKAVIEGILELANNEPEEIININKQADEEVIKNYSVDKKYFPILFGALDEHDFMEFKGFRKDSVYSEITGTKVEKYSDEKIDIKIPYFNKTYIKDSVSVPKYYLIPKEWTQIIEILNVHGVEMDVLGKSVSFKVEKYKFKDVSFASKPYEGRFTAKYSYDVITDSITVPEGTVIINPAQRRLGIILYLLEPKSRDSFVYWGFFNQIFERTEYFETYSMEPIAKKMFENDPVLRNKFLEKVNSDSAFANNPWARLNFFYERTKYYDANHNFYPVIRVVE